MRQLDSCDFCGDAAEGVFEVVPASVADGPVRLALCADCRTTLQTVVDPLLAADAPEPSDGSASTRSNRGAPSGESVEDEPDTGDKPDASDEPDADDESGVTIELEDDELEDDETRDGAVGGSPARRPDGYAQVVRLLQNRDGAIAREDLRALATNAYDLGERTFDAAVDAALEAGDVEQTDDGLRTT